MPKPPEQKKPDVYDEVFYGYDDLIRAVIVTGATRATDEQTPLDDDSSPVVLRLSQSDEDVIDTF